MGTSHTRKAGNRLRHIMDMCLAQTGFTSNYKIGEQQYMMDVSYRSFRDGHISGTIYRYVSDKNAVKSGTFYIDPDGTLRRGPKMFAGRMLKIVIDGKDFDEVWKGSENPSDEEVYKFLNDDWMSQFRKGGVNAHAGKDEMPYPSRAEIRDMSTEEVLKTWRAGVFQVWS